MKVIEVKEVNTFTGQDIGLQSKLFLFLAVLSKPRQSIDKYILFVYCVPALQTQQ